MFTLKELFEKLDLFAPLDYSRKLIEKGDYDNSGIIIKSTETANKIMFALDLTENAVKRAKKLGCDTIVTHHPAIYTPLSVIDTTDVSTSAVALALGYKMNVISMHLNLDVSKGGIDQSLAMALGAKEFEILDPLYDGIGYGRLFEIQEIKLKDYLKQVKDNLNTDKIVVYGNKNRNVKRVASFCGGGSGYAEKQVQKGIAPDLVVTSDMPHHVLKYLIEKEISVMIITHYASENYGFKKFYEHIYKTLNGKAEVYYFDDERFM